jgi:hypothetical protein
MGNAKASGWGRQARTGGTGKRKSYEKKKSAGKGRPGTDGGWQSRDLHKVPLFDLMSEKDGPA